MKTCRGDPLWSPDVEGRDINLESGCSGNPLWLPSSPLIRKGRGSHPVLGSGLKQRRQQRENVVAIPCGCPVGTGFKPVHGSRFKMFANNHLLDPDFF